jgi:hypothetical protein
MKRQSAKEQQVEAKQRAFLAQPLPRDRDAAIAELTKLLGYCSVEFIHTCITLQRHFRVLTKFAHVESRFRGCKPQGKAVLDILVNPCVKSVCSRSVAVGIKFIKLKMVQDSVHRDDLPSA